LRRHTLRYGDSGVDVSMTSGAFAGSVEPATPESSATPRDLLRASLESPIGSPPLREIARGKHTAAILIPGKTRVAATRDYVPALVAELEAGGIEPGNVEVFLATGTHEHHLECDVESLLGEETASRVRVGFHDCRDESGLEMLGTTSFGTPVLINRRVLQADVRVLTGRIVPHYFAGFSGGRKALIPGVAGIRTITANHRLTLDPERGMHPMARPCALEGNPVHMDMLEGTRMAAPEFTLNTLLDARHRLVGAVAGAVEAAHAEGCRLADEMFHVRVDGPVDALVTSAGGTPYDCNFMQSLKAVMNVRDLVRPGGAILWIAECPFGIQPEFLTWSAIDSDARMEDAVRSKYDLKGHNSMMLRALSRHADVALLSALPAETVRALGFHPVASPDEGARWLRDRFRGDFTYAVVPYANVTHAST
jgi:lactate racemase